MGCLLDQFLSDQLNNGWVYLVFMEVIIGSAGMWNLMTWTKASGTGAASLLPGLD
jgi:hypothetical protein